MTLTGRPAWRRSLALSIAFVMGLAALLSALSLLLDRVTVRDPQSKIKWLAATRNRTFGYAVLGTSRAFLTTDVAALDRRWGTSGINLGLNGTPTPELDLVWDDFLSRNQVGCLLLEVDVVGLDSATWPYQFHDYEYLPHIRDSIVFRHLAAERGFRAYLWRYLPFAGYAQFNDRALVAMAQVARAEPPMWDSTGTQLIDRSFDFTEFSGWTVKRYSVDSSRAARLDSILTRSRRQNVNVVMYMAPEYFDVDRFQPNRQEMVEYYRAKARAFNVPFLDAEKNPIRADTANYFDPSHLNRRGAGRFTESLGRSLDSLPVRCVDRGSRAPVSPGPDSRN